jgi:TolB-like protein/DNA-binding winged helix-turn-helix (wHTH) protein/tetratricopeptide (TPR) repeat protein
MNHRSPSRRSPRDGAAALRYRVADLEVDLGRVRVARDGREIALPRLSFDLLVALLRVAPNVATYEELMREVWPGVIVGSETVSQRVKLLREALGDDARESRYVASVRGRGYRLVPEAVALPDAVADSPASTTARDDGGPAPAVPVPASGAPAAMAPALEEPPRPTESAPSRWHTRRRVPIVLGAAGFAVAAIALAGWFGNPLMRGDGAADLAARAAAPVRPSAGTVAVLPFDSIGPDAVEPYVGRGIAEMVLNRLSGSRALDVVARTSSFALDARGMDAAQIGRRLGARYLVQGGVQRAGERLRVTVQIVDVESGRELGAMRFDQSMADLFAVQDEIAAQVAQTLDVQVSAARPGTRNPDAHVAYLQGLELLGRWRVAAAEAASAHFARARELDPSFAAAYVGQANAQEQLAVLRGEDQSRYWPELRRLADRALELDPRLGSAWVIRGRLTEDPVAAEKALRRAIELSPSDAAGYLALGDVLSRLGGREKESLAALDRAVALDPLQPRPHYIRAIVRYLADGSDHAYRENLQAVLAIDPSYPSALTRLGLLEASVFGHLAEGVALLERALAADPTAAFVREAAATIYLSLADWDAAAEVSAGQPREAAFRLAVALGRGDRHAAAALALPERSALVRGFAPTTAVGTVAGFAAVVALQDAALRSGRTEEGIAALREYHCDLPTQDAPDDGPNAKPRAASDVECVQPWTLPAATALAHLHAVRGERAVAQRIATAVLQLADSEQARRLPYPFVMTSRARALAVLGRWDDAIRSLEATRGARAGNLGWWFVFRNDPTFEPVRTDARFRAVFDATRRDVDAERAALAAMRADGRVPRRPAA